MLVVLIGKSKQYKRLWVHNRYWSYSIRKAEFHTAGSAPFICVIHLARFPKSTQIPSNILQLGFIIRPRIFNKLPLFYNVSRTIN